MKTYKCGKCGKEITAIISKKPRCKECQEPMYEVAKKKEKEYEIAKSGHIYAPTKNKGLFKVGNKIVQGIPSKNTALLRFIERAFENRRRE